MWRIAVAASVVTALAASMAAASATAPPATFVLTCATSVRGAIAPPGADDTVFGPLAFRGLKRAARLPWSQFSPLPGGGWRTLKAAPILAGGRAATVVIPARERAFLRVGYPGGHGYVVRFEACGGSGYSGWPGGFELRRPACGRLDVWVDGRAQPLRRTISFGAGACRR